MANTEKLKTTPCSWSPSEEARLVDLLLEHRDKGNQTDSGFKPIVFQDIASCLRARPPESGPVKSSDAVKNKYNAVSAATCPRSHDKSKHDVILLAEGRLEDSAPNGETVWMEF